MLRLRQYKKADADGIARWVREQDTFLKWGGTLFGDYPIDAGVIAATYDEKNGLCEEADNFYPWIAMDEDDRPVGHFIMRYTNGDHKLLRFGWVVVDDTIRGKGYGAEMLRLGLQYAFDILKVEKVTLGVYEGNDSAHACYKKVGFHDTHIVEKEPWNVIEMEITKEEARR